MAVGVLWLQVWALALMQGAITLAWVFYQLYLPSLLTELGVAASVATVILVVENGLSTLVEPLVGSCSDQTQRWLGTRFPWIVGGAVGAALVLVLIPGVLGLPLGVARTLLISLLLVWALAMSVFRSPVLSLLGRYAFGMQLPQAASILTLVGAVAAAVGVVAQPWLVSLGAGVAFTLGSVMLLTATLLLQRIHPAGAGGSAVVPAGRLSLPRLGLIFGTGMAVSIGFRLLLQSLPEPKTVLLGSLFITVALTAIPTGTLASRWGNGTVMAAGLGAMAVGLPVLTQGQPLGMGVALAVLLGASLSVVMNGAIPFALGLVPPAQAGLGTGMYFGGGALGASLFFGVLGTGLGTMTGAWVGAGAFAVAAGLVLLSPKPTEQS